jgi:hypothetical protein
MKLAEVSVKRPVFAIMMTAALIVLGAFSYKDLGLDLMPKPDSPNVNVQVQLPGASAEEVETQITKRIEEAVNTISGIDELRANSNQAGPGNITFALSETSNRPPRTSATRWPRSSTSSARRETAEICETGSDRRRSSSSTSTVPGAEGDHADRRQADQAGARNRRAISSRANASEIQLLLNADRLNAYGLASTRSARGHAPERRGSGRRHRRPLRGGAPMGIRTSTISTDRHRVSEGSVHLADVGRVRTG